MAKILIIGSGPAAAAVAMAVTAAGSDEVDIVDIGEQLEPGKQRLLTDVAAINPDQWPDAVARQLTQQPAAEVKGELPQKKMFGSDFPFRDRGQLESFATAPGGNRWVVSGAFGGFSNAWGAQVMPFSRATIDQWPVGYDDLLPHYRAVLEQIPFAGADDDYSELFPLLADADPLPPLSPPATELLGRYRQRRRYVRRRGVIVGEARLALRSSPCIECGLCLTGCPYDLIYSASHTIAKLIESRRVTYTAGRLAQRVGEDERGPWAQVLDLATRQTAQVRADRIFLACGGLGSTRVVLGSARPAVRRLTMAEAVQFVLPFVSLRRQPDPRTYTTFTLNQFNMLVTYGRPGLDLAQLHLYPYNPAFEDSLPRVARAFPLLQGEILRRTTAALGYLPSWASPKLLLDVGVADGDGLPPVSVSSERNGHTGSVLRRVFQRLLAVAPALDLWPVLPVLSISGPAKSYHFGASLPHVIGAPRPDAMETDALGRIAEWKRVHIVDGSVLPSVPATTFTLTVMANAHRIATGATHETA
jgi:choline dehydrogenase-like flavoprotein